MRRLNQALDIFEFLSAYNYPGPRGFLLFFVGKFCDTNGFYFFLLARSTKSWEKKAISAFCY